MPPARIVVSASFPRFPPDTTAHTRRYGWRPLKAGATGDHLVAFRHEADRRGHFGERHREGAVDHLAAQRPHLREQRMKTHPAYESRAALGAHHATGTQRRGEGLRTLQLTGDHFHAWVERAHGAG